jgi:hypothetical protein
MPLMLNRLYPAIALSLILSGASCSAPLNYTTSWFGNTFASAWEGNHGSPVKHVQQTILGAFVTPDGLVLANSGWDEGGIDCGAYKDGDIVGRCDFGAGGWGRDGGDAVTVSDKYVYAVMRQDGGIGNRGNPNGLGNEPGAKTTWYCIERLTRDYVPAPWPAGLGFNGAMLDVSTQGDLHGVAVDSQSRLYVADTPNNQIKVYDGNSMAPVSSWPLDRPGQIAVDPDDSLWIMQIASGANAPQIVHRSADGHMLPGIISFPLSMKPMGFCLRPDTRQLLVADCGVDQNIKVYDMAKLRGVPTVIAATLGVKGGVFAGPLPGATGDWRFCNPTAVGVDAQNNLYVCGNSRESGVGGTIESFNLVTRHRAANWPHALYGLLWLDSCDADPEHDTDFYSGDKHFAFNYGGSSQFGDPQSARTGSGAWSLSAVTCNPWKYAGDPRLFMGGSSASVFARRISGKLILYMTDQYSGDLRIYRFDRAADGDTAIPCGLIAKEHVKKTDNGSSDWPPFQPASGEWIWRDTNGDGKFDTNEYENAIAGSEQGWGWGVSVDTQGNIWTARGDNTVGELPIQGLDTHGSPVYHYGASKVFPKLPFVTELLRADYQPETDTMFLAGYTANHPHTGGEWGILGTEIIVVPRWGHGNQTPSTRIVLPYDWSQTLFCKSMCEAGDYVFAVEGRKSNIHVYNVHTGVEVGTISPGANVAGTGGWVDMTYGLRAFKRSNGEYVIICEEDGFIKNLVYGWTPDASAAP